MLDVLELIMLVFLAWMVITRQGEGGWRSVLGRQSKIILDSCALIDGRIVEVVRTGFMADELIIPQFILSELQLLADGHDSHKRERARYGLDIAHELQDTAPMKVTIDRTVLQGVQATDDKLVALAKKIRGRLYTTDYNLSKVASIEGVKVLNVNELAQSLRPITLPGETITIKIIQKGSNRDQGVGYLEDGTMIVVDGAARFVGSVVPVTVTRMHQTVAGKMVFGQVKVKEQAPKPQQEQHDRHETQHTEHPRADAHVGHAPEPQRPTGEKRAKLHHRLTRTQPKTRRLPKLKI